MKRKVFGFIILVMFLASLSCQMTGGGELEEPAQAGEVQEDFPPTEPPAEDVEPTEIVELTQPEPEPQLVEIRQWAIEASASSEYGSDEWSAMQAAGEPDTPDCGRAPTAWAGYYEDREEYLDLVYETAVIPTEINIYQTYNPDGVSEVWLYEEAYGGLREVYKAVPEAKEECPHILSVPIADADYRVKTVRIWVDQEVMGDFTEIDAVELVGEP